MVRRDLTTDGENSLFRPGVPQHFECVIETHKEWNGADIRIRQEGVFEINRKERGMCVSALEVRFPKQESQSADADEYKHCS